MRTVNFLMGNNSNIDDEGGRGGQKGHFRVDVTCERSLTPPDAGGDNDEGCEERQGGRSDGQHHP